VKDFENYLVFYRSADPGIKVLRVLHGAQDLDAIFQGEE
jgi:plasmid stabilization system protein ParE